MMRKGHGLGVQTGSLQLQNAPNPPDAAHPGGWGQQAAEGSERSATTQFTHVNVTLGNLHWFQASILEKVPACHL